MIRKLFLTFWFCASYNFALVGDWQSFTHLDLIQCMQEYKGKLFVGTSGGIRVLSGGSSEQVFNNPQFGMYDVNIVAMTKDNKGELWALSRNGVLYHWENTKKFKSIDRGFNELGWVMNDRALINVDNYLLLGSNKGLSFFSLEDKKVAFSISNFGLEKNVSVSSIRRVDSLLYVGTSRGVFRAPIFWEKPQSAPKGFPSIFNPETFENVNHMATTEALVLSNYSLIVPDADTVLVYPVGDFKNSEIEILVVPTGSPKFGSNSYSKITGMTVGEYFNDQAYIGNESGLYIIKNDSLDFIRNPSSIPNIIPANIKLSQSGIVIWGLREIIKGGPYFQGIYDLIDGNVRQRVELPFSVAEQFASGIEPFANFMRGIQVYSQDQFTMGTWGSGLFWIEDSKYSRFYKSDSCLRGISGLTNPDFTVIWSTAKYEGTNRFDHGLLFGEYTGSSQYNLAYLDSTTKEITCFQLNGLSSEAINPHDINVIDENTILVSGNHGVDIYEVNNIKRSNGLTLKNSLRNTAAISPSIFGATLDAFDRMWVVSPEGVYYSDTPKDTANDSLILMENLEGKKCNRAKTDGIGEVWLGCEEGLIQITPADQFPASEINIYTNREGLLMNAIYDFDIEKETGNIWIATNAGISKFESPSKKLNENLNNIEVYPNPFLKKHDFVLFNGMTGESEVMLFTQSGTLIRRAGNQEVNGGQWRWDGNNESGNKVAPGIYYYAVKAGKKVEKGKIIVGR